MGEPLATSSGASYSISQRVSLALRGIGMGVSLCHPSTFNSPLVRAKKTSRKLSFRAYSQPPERRASHKKTPARDLWRACALAKTCVRGVKLLLIHADSWLASGENVSTCLPSRLSYPIAGNVGPYIRRPLLVIDHGWTRLARSAVPRGCVAQAWSPLRRTARMGTALVCYTAWNACPRMGSQGIHLAHGHHGGTRMHLHGTPDWELAGAQQRAKALYSKGQNTGDVPPDVMARLALIISYPADHRITRAQVLREANLLVPLAP
jgi:hypothetical protein